MKKTLTTCLCLWLTYAPHMIKAIDLPTIPEGGMADHAIKIGGGVLDVMSQEGIANGFFIAREKRNAGGIQLATRIWQSNRSYVRAEGNILWLSAGSNEQEPDSVPTENGPDAQHFKPALFKVGLSGRHVVNHDFIPGWYVFYDKPMSDKHSWNMLNTGIELIFPRAISVSGDAILDPINFFGDYRKRFYQFSVKASVIRPNVVEGFVAMSRVKYPKYIPSITTMGGATFQFPFKKWNIHRFISLGAAVTHTYNEKVDKIFRPGAFGFSIFLQVNLQQRSPTRSLQSFLRMPINRFYATPYHPGIYKNNLYTKIGRPRPDLDRSDTTEHNIQDFTSPINPKPTNPLGAPDNQEAPITEKNTHTGNLSPTSSRASSVSSTHRQRIVMEENDRETPVISTQSTKTKDNSAGSLSVPIGLPEPNTEVKKMTSTSSIGSVYYDADATQLTPIRAGDIYTETRRPSISNTSQASQGSSSGGSGDTVVTVVPNSAKNDQPDA